MWGVKKVRGTLDVSALNVGIIFGKEMEE